MSLLPVLPWYLKGPLEKAFAFLSQLVLDQMETKAQETLRSASVEHSTQTGFNIQKSDLVIPPPPQASEALQRVFVQFYREVLSKNATPEGIALVPVILGVSWYKEDLQDPAHPALGLHPYFALRYWTNAQGGDLDLVRELFSYLAPARCLKHAQIEHLAQPAGFGASPFGARFGDRLFDFETPIP